MPNKSLTVEQVVALLAESPGRIAALAADLAPSQLNAKPGEDAWSANDILAHLRACADVWGDCMKRILNEDWPTIRALNPLTRINQTDYREQGFKPSLRAFATQREELMAVLEPLDREAWSRAGTVTGAGRELERSVLFYGRWMAGHERTHLKQIERLPRP